MTETKQPMSELAEMAAYIDQINRIMYDNKNDKLTRAANALRQADATGAQL